MRTQFSHKYSIPRLESEGEVHWFDGKIYEHPRADLIELFDKYYQEALEAGYSIDDYRVQPFGNYPKASQVNHSGNKVTNPDKRESRLKRLITSIKKRLP